jgi:hypothetical protein
MRRGLLYQCCSCNFYHRKMPSCELSGISTRFRVLFQSDRQIAHVLLTRPPLTPKGPLDLHVLGTPPAFVLSQDQTLNKCCGCSFEHRLTCVTRLFLAWCVCLVFKEPSDCRYPSDFFVASFSRLSHVQLRTLRSSLKLCFSNSSNLFVRPIADILRISSIQRIFVSALLSKQPD